MKKSHEEFIKLGAATMSNAAIVLDTTLPRLTALQVAKDELARLETISRKYSEIIRQEEASSELRGKPPGENARHSSDQENLKAN